MNDYEDFPADYKLIALGIHFGVLQSLLNFEPDVNREQCIKALSIIRATFQGIDIDEEILWHAVTMGAEMLGLNATMEEKGEVIEFPTKGEEDGE